MSGDALEDALRRIVRENQEARARSEKIAARTSSAIVAGDWDALQAIVKEAGNDGSDGDSESTGDFPAASGAGSP